MSHTSVSQPPPLSHVKLFRDLSFELPAGEILGVIGPNGAGKSSLIRLISGEEQPDDGTIRLGDTVSLGHVNQNRSGLDPSNTVYEEVSQVSTL